MKDWRDYPTGREKYQLYLASREWAVLKEAVKARSDGTCERCRSAPGQSVHHQTYERVYEERLEDLVHLCSPCHEFLSGKRDDDPVMTTPARLFGRTIFGVYLAGKISGATWRDEIIAEGWSHGTRGELGCHAEADYPNRWEIAGGCVPLPDGRRLDFTGPYWRPSGYDYGNHCPEPPAGIHLYAKSTRDGSGKLGIDPGLPDLTRKIQQGILTSDLVFAWIDCHDCYGTLIVIGFAAAHDKIVVLAWPTGFAIHDFWLAEQVAVISGHAASAKQAWDELWMTPHLAEVPRDL